MEPKEAENLGAILRGWTDTASVTELQALHGRVQRWRDTPARVVALDLLENLIQHHEGGE